MNAAADQPGNDIDFVAEVEAEQLRFSEAPDSRVEFFGTSGRDSASGSVRRGLPDSVENHVTYRNVRVDYRIRSRLVDNDGGIVDAVRVSNDSDSERPGPSRGPEGGDDGTTTW